MILDQARALRRFGADARLQPHPEQLRPGDAILVSPQAGIGLHNLIQRAQRRSFSWDDSRWHHAAVFAGPATTPAHLCDFCAGGSCQHQIIEARLKGGVTQSCLLPRLKDHLMRVRRNPEMNDQQRLRLVQNAVSQVGTGYNYVSAIFAAIPAGAWILETIETLRQHGDDAGAQEIKQRFLCSTLYVDAHDKAVPGRHRLSRTADDEIPTPALLSHSSILEDVPVEWQALAPC